MHVRSSIVSPACLSFSTRCAPPEDDEFVDARSHETSDIDVSEQSLRQAAVGNSDSNNGNDAGPVMDPAGDDRDAKQASSDMRRMFRMRV